MLLWRSRTEEEAHGHAEDDEADEGEAHRAHEGAQHEAPEHEGAEYEGPENIGQDHEGGREDAPEEDRARRERRRPAACDGSPPGLVAVALLDALSAGLRACSARGVHSPSRA